MRGRFSSVAIAVLLCINIAFGANTFFNNGTGNNFWKISGNWDGGLPGSGDYAYFNAPETCLINSSTSAQCGLLYVAHNGSNSLDITGGTLTVLYNFYIQANGSTTGTVNISKGIVSANHLAVAYQGTGILNMTDGTVNVSDQLWIPYGNNGVSQGETAEVHLDGGTINCTNFHMHAGGSLDIAGGTLVIDGDKTSDILTYKNNGWITAYGYQSFVEYDFNITNSGKTTVTGSMPPSSASNPNPGHNTLANSTEVTLQWEPALGSVSHDVYLGTDENVVSAAVSSFLPGDLDEKGQVETTDLAMFSDAWMHNPVAQQPSPNLDGESTVNLKDFAIMSLNWLGESEYKGNHTAASYGPLTLEPGDYWWRIDEVDNESAITKGPLWCFTVTLNPNAYLTLDAFFARGDLTSEELVLKSLVYHSPTYDPIWRAHGGFMSPPRIIGFVANDSYCQQYAPVLRDNVNHSNSEVRYAVAERLAELKGAEGFEVLLDALKAETSQAARGGDKWLFEYPGIADRLIAMIGHPDGYDPKGTKALRDAVIEKWRGRWLTEGDSWLRGLKKAQNYSPVTGSQKLELQGKTVATRSMSDMEEFFLLGSSKIYEFAAMDGRFPPAGLLLGDDAGIWSHPVKVLDGFEYTIKESGYADWKLLDCVDFVQKLHSTEFNFSQNNLTAKRTDFAVENDSAFFTVLTLTNDTPQARTVSVDFSGRVNIRPAWLSGWVNDLDVVSYDAASGVIEAYDSTYTQIATVFGSDQTPSGANVAGNVGTLTYDITVDASGSTEIAFLIVSEKLSGTSAAKQRFSTLASQRTTLQTARENTYQKKLFTDVGFSCSNADITNAFACAKANMMMMTIDAQPWQVGPYFNGGTPEYTSLFGCDTEYAIAGATAGGFGETAKTNLQCLANFAQKQSGRVPHQVTTSGSIIASGNSQETQQFVVACGNYFDWTGDTVFLNNYYNQMKQSINYVLGNLDADADHYPEGYSILELGGMNGENVDSACYLYKAFDVMAGFADYLGNTSDAATYTSYANTLKTNFNSDFWNASQQMWGDSLVGTTPQMLGYWVRNIPQEIAIADPAKAVVVLDKMEAWGTDRYCPYTNGIVVLGAYNYGDSEQGWNRLKWNAEAPMVYGMLGGFENVTVAPDDIPLIESPSLFLQGIMEGLCGISPDAVNHKVEIFPQPPAELDDLSLNNFYIGQHKLDLSWAREPDGDQEIVVFHESGPVAMNVTVRIKSGPGQTIKLNGSTITPSAETVRGIVTKPVTISLNAGQQAVIRVE